MIWRLAPLAGILLLAACGMVGRNGLETELQRTGDPFVFGNLEVLSLVNTHKTMGDHLISFVVGKDCSTPRAEREGVYCTDWPSPPPPPQQVYCYRSLGKASCYSQPYNEGNDHLIGFVPASAPMR
ncbi:MAG: hypothetical protein ACM31L_18745 [Actinomycetota bacterium]